ncbi:hypothetical protein C8T65DRAFT_699317 [Cerioporus squamosus]|nr:hypothetical protein C8T65DRAFT_699317 [Cerioporus squamosus]
MRSPVITYSILAAAAVGPTLVAGVPTSPALDKDVASLAGRAFSEYAPPTPAVAPIVGPRSPAEVEKRLDGLTGRIPDSIKGLGNGNTEGNSGAGAGNGGSSRNSGAGAGNGGGTGNNDAGAGNRNSNWEQPIADL